MANDTQVTLYTRQDAPPIQPDALTRYLVGGYVSWQLPTLLDVNAAHALAQSPAVEIRYQFPQETVRTPLARRHRFKIQLAFACAANHLGAP